MIAVRPSFSVLETTVMSISSWTSRKGTNNFADLKGKKMSIASSEWDDKQVELIKLYNEIVALECSYLDDAAP